MGRIVIWCGSRGESGTSGRAPAASTRCGVRCSAPTTTPRSAAPGAAGGWARPATPPDLKAGRSGRARERPLDHLPRHHAPERSTLRGVPGSGRPHRIASGRDQRRVDASGLGDPGEARGALEVVETEPGSSVRVGPPVGAWPVVFGEPAEKVLLLACVPGASAAKAGEVGLELAVDRAAGVERQEGRAEVGGGGDGRRGRAHRLARSEGGQARPMMREGRRIAPAASFRAVMPSCHGQDHASPLRDRCRQAASRSTFSVKRRHCFDMKTEEGFFDGIDHL